METESLLTCSQEPTTGPYPIPDEYVPCLRSLLVLSSHLLVGLPSGPFPQGLTTNILDAFLLSNMRATCHSHLILPDFILQYTLCNNAVFFMDNNQLKLA
jgi:hypothetical protein